MNIIEFILGAILRRIERIKGDRILSVIRVHQDPNDGYKAVLNDGNLIQIFCNEITYKVTYSKWWVRDNDISIYHVYCMCSQGTPQALKDKLSTGFTITQLLHSLSYREDQKKAAISAYVDVILSAYTDEIK